MALIKILIDTGSDSYSELDNLQSRKESLPKVINYLKAINSGASSASVTVNKEVVEATSSITVSGTGQVNNETFTVNGETFTFKTSGVSGFTGTFVEPSGTLVATTATNIANAIEGQTLNKKLEGVVGASAAAGVVTVTFDEGGKVGNALDIAESVTDLTSAEGATGTNGTSTTLTSG